MAKHRSFRGHLYPCNFAQKDYKMSDYTVNIELYDYLRQWLIHENGGVEPIVLPRLSTENKILEMSLIKTPHNAIPDLPTETSVAIAIPYFKYKHPKTYHYLPRVARETLAEYIRKRFIMQLWTDLHRYGWIGRQKQELLYIWMTAHGIEHTEKNWNALAKICQREHKNYLERRRRSKKVQK